MFKYDDNKQTAISISKYVLIYFPTDFSLVAISRTEWLA